MCGIFGAVTKKEAVHKNGFIRRSLNILAKASQSRGKDSSGLAFRDEERGVYDVFKGAVPLDFLFSSSAVTTRLDRALSAYSKGASTFAVMGHSRLVTNGSQLHDGNNQPVIRDGIIGIHNGIIVNDDALWSLNSELSPENDIDTEVFLALIRKHLQSGHSLSSAIKSATGEIEGTVSTALFFDDFPALALATNNGSLYTLTNHRDMLFFASEHYPLRSLAEKMRIDLEGEYEVGQIVSLSGVILTFDNFNLEWFKFGDTASRAGPAANAKSFEIDISTVSNGKAPQELVRDVALIARGAAAAKEEALLEFNQARVAELRRCSKCVLPETFTFIEYDDLGVCNYCNNYRVKNTPKPIDELLELIEPYRRSDGTPDCIVPFSGGRDSTYALHIIKTKLGLNPIAFTYDWGMVTDLGRRNIARVCGKLGVENIIVAADIYWKRENIRKNITAWLSRPHLGMIPLFMAGDKYFYYFVDQVKRQTGIKLNIWGINPLENTDFKVGFIGVGPDHEKKRIYSLSLTRQAKLFWGIGKAVLSNPRYLNSSIWDTMGSFVSRSVMPHTDYFHLYDYFRWDEHEIDRLLFNEYDWEKAIDTQTTWRIGDGTASFYNYIYYNVSGFSEHDTFRSNQIREGDLTRDEAISLVNTENRPRYATIKWYTDVVGIDYEHAIKTINAIPQL